MTEEDIARDIYTRYFDDAVNYPYVLEAITAGVKEGVSLAYSKVNEWHDLRKDPDDLPKENELVLIKITGCFVLGWTNSINWFNDSNNGTIIDRRMIIAWCEIPKFEEG